MIERREMKKEQSVQDKWWIKHTKMISIVEMLGDLTLLE